MKYIIVLLLVLAACASPNGSGQREVETMTNPIVTIKTNMGSFDVELFMDTMPETAGNFKKLVEEGFYDGIIFHRIIADFMIQGGDPTGTGTGGPGYKIPDEKNPDNANLRGTFSMANAGANTGGSQFFINLVDNRYLDGKTEVRPGVKPYHPVFGKVVSGMDVVDNIGKVKVDRNDRPLEEVKIINAKIK